MTFFLFGLLGGIVSLMTSSRTSRSEVQRLLERLLDRDVLDIHGVARTLGISRSSVNTLIALEEKGFPAPLYESTGENRHPVRLWWRADIEEWSESRPSSRTSSASVKSKKR